MKYRYIYIDRIGRFYLRARPHLSLGSTLHSVLRTYHEEGGRHSAAELVSHMEEKWVSAGFESAEQEQEYRAAGAEIVQAYTAAFEKRPAVETETILSEKQIKTDMGRFWLAGRIDRVDRHADGSLEIIDYKSGRLTVTSEEVAADLAMSIYQLILRRMYPGTRVSATLFCLRSGDSASCEMTDFEAESFAADMTEIGEEIVSRDFENVEPVRIEACEWCEFLRRCERYWRYIERMQAIAD